VAESALNVSRVEANDRPDDLVQVCVARVSETMRPASDWICGSGICHWLGVNHIITPPS